MLEFFAGSVIISPTLPFHTCSSTLFITDYLFSLLHANKNKYCWVSPSALPGKGSQTKYLSFNHWQTFSILSLSLHLTLSLICYLQ